MTAAHFLREDIREVFSIFDEDGAGTITLQELAKALYTITGERVQRSELAQLIAYGEGEVAKKQQADAAELHKLELSASPSTEIKGGEGGGSVTQSAVHVGLTAAREASPTYSSMGNKNNNDSSAGHSPGRRLTGTQPLDLSEGISVDLFEQVVLRKLQHRSYEEELAYTFTLLEDPAYAGFITKESVRKVAAETGEALTEAEVAEMFDSLVTGAPSAAVDLATFIDLQMAARKAEDAGV